MGGIVAESQRRIGPARQGTPFEKNLLPSFAAWVVEQIERHKPDYLVPVETKGVHILDAALAYAREALGINIATPVLYTSGLTYLNSHTLKDSRVMVVDDAMKSGANLGRAIREIRSQGVSEIVAIVFMGAREEELVDPDLNAECYLRVDGRRYDQYLWQLTDLVVARGLPPEVDHSVYELKLPGRFTVAWRDLEHQLARYGFLTVDAPRDAPEPTAPMTLHFPLLPGMPRVPAAAEGPDKVRFFPDPDGNRSYVVPICFPAVTFAPNETGIPLTQRSARRALHRVTGGRSAAGELLLQRARVLDHQTVFRAASVAREVEIMCGVARLLPTENVQMRGYQDVFERLFGARVAADLTGIVTRQIARALEEGESKASRRRAVARGARQPTYLDETVPVKTRRIAETLKGRSRQALGGTFTGELVGLSMPHLSEQLTGGDRLLASRCVSFGLAATTLAPFIGAETHPDGTLTIERYYRVSEPIRGLDRAYRDRDLVRKQKAEQALAVICNRLSERSTRYEKQPIPLKIATYVVALLGPLVLDDQPIHLTTQATRNGIRLVLPDPVTPAFVTEGQDSRYYSVDKDHRIVPTVEFAHQYVKGTLNLDVDGTTEAIENHVDELAGLIDELDPSEIDSVLESWAMSTDRRLGLTHIHSCLKATVEEMTDALATILTGEDHERAPDLQEQVKLTLGVAREKLELLGGDWAATPKARWGVGAGRREQRLLNTLGAPERSSSIYALAQTLTSIYAVVAGLVEQLDEVSYAAWRTDQENAAHDQVGGVLQATARVRRAMTSLTGDDGTLRPVPATARDAITMAAEDLLDLVERIGAMAAALCGEFRGEREGPRPSARGPVGRHISILDADIDGYTEHGEACDERSHNRWARSGLDLAAQWTRTFGGWERPEPKGDELIVEFAEDGDASVLAASAIQCHAQALRSTGVEEISWGFHLGIDCGQVEEEHGAVQGRCINRAAKIAKAGDGKSEPARIMMTQDARDRCSLELQGAPLGEKVSLGDGEMYEVHPVIITAGPVLASYIRRLAETARELTQALSERPRLTQTLRLAPASEDSAADTGGQMEA